MSTGGRCSRLEESTSIMGVPPLSKPMFIDIERCIGLAFEDYLTELMLKAGQEEKQLVIEMKHNIMKYLPSVLLLPGGVGSRGHMAIPTMPTQVLVLCSVLQQRIFFI